MLTNSKSMELFGNRLVAFAEKFYFNIREKSYKQKIFKGGWNHWKKSLKRNISVEQINEMEFRNFLK